MARLPVFLLLFLFCVSVNAVPVIGGSISTSSLGQSLPSTDSLAETSTTIAPSLVDENCCPVCYEQFDGSEITGFTCEKHPLCKKCLDSVTTKSKRPLCPMCRLPAKQEILEQKLEKLVIVDLDRLTPTQLRLRLYELLPPRRVLDQFLLDIANLKQWNKLKEAIHVRSHPCYKSDSQLTQSDALDSTFRKINEAGQKSLLKVALEIKGLSMRALHDVFIQILSRDPRDQDVDVIIDYIMNGNVSELDRISVDSMFLELSGKGSAFQMRKFLHLRIIGPGAVEQALLFLTRNNPDAMITKIAMVLDYALNRNIAVKEEVLVSSLKSMMDQMDTKRFHQVARSLLFTSDIYVRAFQRFMNSFHSAFRIRDMVTLAVGLYGEEIMPHLCPYLGSFSRVFLKC